MGGLGNQMFQYAAGRAVAHRTNMPLKLDITYFETVNLRTYQLNYFNIQEDFASLEDIECFKPSRKQIVAFTNFKIRAKLLPWQKQKLIKEREFLYNPDIIKIKGDAYLEGYWQSEKYFKDVSDIIRREFNIKHKPSNTNSQMLTEIDSVNSVSLHIRRGDYVFNPMTMQIHGVLSLDYYINALNIISKKVKKLHVFVFSDDLPWVKENLKTCLPLNFIDHNKDEQDYEDLRLISRCKHHIIANSSFSWWGAWLSEYSNKIIIAPRRWFNNNTVDTRDLIPERWIKI
jgi:hypothetical protein